MKNSEKPGKRGCFCPYCDEEVAVATPLFCQLCKAELRYCTRCNIIVEKKATACPQCGQTLE